MMNTTAFASPPASPLDVELSVDHATSLIRGSGLAESVIKSRGYRTVTTKDELIQLGFKPYQALPGLLIPIWSAIGRIVNYQIRPDKPRVSEDGKPIKYETRAGSKPSIDVPPICLDAIKDPSKPLWITEGVKKADCGATYGLIIAAVLGVHLFRGRNSQGGKTAIPDFEYFHLDGRTVHLAFDSDYATNPGVTQALISLGGLLELWGAKVVYVTIPPAADGSKVGLDDWFVSGGTVARLLAEHISIDPPFRRPKRSMNASGDGKLPQIVLNNREAREVLSDALKALDLANQPPRLFLRGGRICRVESDEKHGHLIKSLGSPELRWELIHAADWLLAGKDDAKHVWPPKDVAEMICASGALPGGFQPLYGLSGAPVLCSNDWSFRREPGYDPNSRWFVTEPGPWPEWTGTAEEAAAFVLTELFGDFPFANQASKANALGLFLLPFVRSAISGPTPLHFIDAPTPGTGKSLLGELALFAGLGTIAATSAPNDENEFEKLLFGMILEGASCIFFDNLKGRLNSPSLEKCLTSGRVKGRVLGGSATPTLDVTSIFVLTANNGKLSTDTARRSVWIRIDAQCESPGDREGFRHSDIRAFVAANRTTLISCALKMIEAWVLLGRPQGLKRKGSYEQWSLMVGGILDVCGVSGFLDNDNDLKSTASEEDELWRPFYEAWFSRYRSEPIETGTLLKMALEHDFLGHIFSRAKSEKGYATAFGRAVSSRDGIVLSGLVIRKSTVRDGLSRFKLEHASGVVDFSTTDTREKNSLFDDHDTADSISVLGEVDRPSEKVHYSTEQVQKFSGLSMPGGEEEII